MTAARLAVSTGQGHWQTSAGRPGQPGKAGERSGEHRRPAPGPAGL